MKLKFLKFLKNLQISSV